ncbi:MAG: T9SS type A sorting domain-containing protein [Saprospiraceae bacterium]
MRQIFILSFSVFFFSLSSIWAQSNCVAPNGTITVDNIDDAGPGSLRAAIHCANASSGESTIIFNLPGSEDHIIYVGASTGLELPALLSSGTIIDGTTQAGFGSNGDFSPKVILDGSQHNWTNAINALWVRASYCEVYGLEIRNFPDDGIDVNQADYCIIGAPNKGNIIYANGAEQDEFPDATPGPWEGCGIVLRNGASNCIVQGNIIGTDETLSPSLSNEYCGIINRTNSNFNLIGGSLPGESNIIAYQAVGVRISNAFACQLVQNSFFCNDSIPIQLVNNGNLNAQEPLINQVTANAISGFAAADAVIEVFAVDHSTCGNAPCRQGKTYLGTTNTIDGTWTLNAPFADNYTLSPGERVTALARDALGNSSAFAICNTFGATSACTDDLGNIWVQNTNDDGVGSLRAAIACANATPGANTIKFNLGNIKDTIKVGQMTGLPLPALTDPGTTIDGTTHAIFGNGSNYQPRIVLDGAFYAWTAPIDALWIQADFCAIYGLEIVNFPDDGIDVTAANYCQIGGVNQGNVVYNNGWEQDYFPDLPNTGPWNGCAIVLRNGASYCKVVGNVLGTDYEQQSTLGNEYCGVIVQNGGDHNQIGGEQAGAGNIIAHHLIGINLSTNSEACSFRRNEMYCNTLDPIRLQVNANNYPQAPSINLIQTNVIAGQAAAGARVEVFRVADNTCTELCQGATYLGTAIASNGNWSLTPPFANGINLASNDVITALATDEDGSSSDFGVCNSLTVGCGITVSISHFNHASCGGANGAVTFNILGGSGFYSYDLGAGNGQSANPIITNIAPGNYTVTISDLINNCSIYYNLLIENRGIPAIQIDSLQATTCAIDNGYLAVSVVGGAPPYSYDLGNGANSNAIFSDLAAGTYNLTVSDVNACSTTSEVIVGDSDAPDLQLVSQTNASCNLGNGSIEVSVMGGLSPYQFDWGDGPTDNSIFTGLTEGNYAITVTDAAACTSIVSVDISNSGIPAIGTLMVTDETCLGGNGTINIVPTGGLPPYTYEVGNTTNTSGFFNNLSAGVYALTLVDAASCVFTQNITIVNVGENPLADFNQSTTGLGLNLNNNSSNAVSYLWDFGDGNTSTMATPNYNYTWSGYYNLCLTVTNDCGTDTNCKGIIVLDPNEALLDFEVEALDGEVGQLMQVPVRVNQFTAISAFQFSLRLENTTTAKFLGATSFNLGGLSNANFNVTDETLTCDWSVANPNGISLPDETILFYLVIEITGTGGDCTPIVFTDNPIQRNAFRQINGVSIKIPTTEMDGLLCVLEPLASVNIFGKVEKENGVVIANAQVNCTNVDSTLTLADGSYAFEDLALGDYVIQPFNDNNPSAGVSVLDVFLMQQHILNINYLDSPYQIIAADVDQSGSVSVLDVFELQRIILNLLDDFSNNTSWRFIPKSHVFANPQFPLGTNFPESVILSDLTADTTMVDFIAMKVGDMTLNANLSNRPPKLEDKYFYTEEQVLEEGRIVTVDFRLTDLEKIAAYQFELNFDTDFLALESTASQTLTNNPHQFGGRYLEEGILSALWMQDFTKDLRPKDAVFTVQFKALKAGKLSEHLRLSARHLSKNAYEADGKTWGLALRFDQPKAVTQSLSLLEQYPNPFATETAIHFALSKTSLVKFEVYDLTGKLVYEHEETYVAGKQLLLLRQTDLPGAGIYFYHLASAGQRISQKIIHQP